MVQVKTAVDRAIPSSLQSVREFVNAVGSAGEPEGHDGGDALAAWAAAAADGGTPLGEDGRRRLLELREALHLTLRAHTGDLPAAPAVAALEAICSRSTLRLVIHPDSSAEVVGAGTGVDALVNGLLATVAIASLDGSWLRLKACANPACGKAFWDATKNRSARFCSANPCGNRIRQQEFRTRHAHRSESRPAVRHPDQPSQS